MANWLSVHLSLPSLLTLTLLAGCGGGSGDEGDPDDRTPTAIGVYAGDGQSARYGTPVGIPPSVVVTGAAGPVANVSVTFTVTEGAGTLTGGTAATDEHGVATLDAWTLGPVPGVNTIKAAVGGLTVQLGATGTAGPPASITITQGNGQTWIQQSLLPVKPAVVVSDGVFPVAGVEVVFTIGSGGGSVIGPPQITLANGLAIVEGWRLGSAPANTLVATVANTSISATITATAEPLVISAVNRIGNEQSGFAGNFSKTPIAVSVLNQFGKPAEGIPVTFRVTGGGGSITGATSTTGVDGRALLGSWRYGTDPSQQVEATAAAEPPVTFYASVAGLVSDYRVNIIYPDGTPNGAVSTAFAHAAARWQALIVGDLPSIVLSGNNAIGPVSFTSGVAGEPEIPCIPRVANTTINDINIYAYVRPIDGARQILAFATPVYLRNSSLLPFAGCMVFDEADMEQVIADGLFERVVLHEMAHVFGFGTLWADLMLLVGACPESTTPSFKGSSSQQAFLAALQPGIAYPNPIVPVEGEGACDNGTRDGHWSESALGSELMTGYVQLGSNPLSAITSASLRDMGYIVNDAPSDPYTVPTPLAGLRTGAAAGLKLHEMRAGTPIIITDNRGRTMQVIDR